MKSHKLKIRSEYYHQVMEEKKRFEVRFNDRDFQEGDTLFLCEWNPDTEFTGNSTKRKVLYVLNYSEEQPLGLTEGYCIMSIADPDNNSEQYKKYLEWKAQRKDQSEQERSSDLSVWGT